MNLINVGAAANKLGVSVALVWKLLRTDPTFPKPINLSARCTRWVESDVEDWVHTRKQGEEHEAGRTDREVHQGARQEGATEESV